MLSLRRTEFSPWSGNYPACCVAKMQNKPKKDTNKSSIYIQFKSSKDEMILFECAYRAGETIRQIEELIIKKSGCLLSLESEEGLELGGNTARTSEDAGNKHIS